MQKILLFSAVLALSFPLAFAQSAVSIDTVVTLQDGRAQAQTHVPMTLQLNIQSGSAQSFVYVVQVIDPDGFTAYISYAPVTLQGGESKALAIPWTPEKEGAHRVQAFAWGGSNSPLALSDPSSRTLDVYGASLCKGSASCFTGTVTKIVDGDTLDVDGTRVRLALVNTPERGQPGYREATSFTAALCPVGSNAIVDEDDRQTAGSYGRMVGEVSCSGKLLNEQLLTAGHAEILTSFCGKSEFASETWARQFGC